MMTDRQTAFFRSLLEPFPPESYYTSSRGGRSFTYIKARTIMVRLDDIVGPSGWTASYSETKNGHKCQLKILCPDHTEDGWAWHLKEDGGGREDMGAENKKTGEWEPDSDNDEKSSYTNAFRRAASVWGFGRELYNEGVPRWIADLHHQAKVVTPKDPPPPVMEQLEQHGDHAPKPANAPQPQSTYKPPEQNGQRTVNLTPPSMAKGLFPWIKSIEKHYGREIIQSVNAHCTKTFGTWDTRQLNDEQGSHLARWVISAVKTWDEYGGEFDDKDEVIPDRPNHTPNPEPKPPLTPIADPVKPNGTELGNLKRSIVALVKAIIAKQTERDARDSEVATMVCEIAATVPDGENIYGSVLGSLLSCNDRQWLMRIMAKAKDQFARAASMKATAVDDDLGDIPF